MLINELLGYAASLAGKVDKAYAKSFNYLEIAGFYLDCRNKIKCQDILADCFITIESLKHPEEKADRLAWLGRVYVRLGDQVKAKEAFSRATLLAGACEPAETVRGLYNVVCEYLDAGMEENTKELTSQLGKAITALPNDTDKALELINVADIYAELDQTDRTQEILGEALKISLRLKDNWLKAERLVDVAQGYQDIGAKDKTASVIQEAIMAAGLTGEENRSYFLLKISDLLIAEGETAKAFEVLSKAIILVQRDESAYERLKNTLLAAEKYYKAGKAEEALHLTLQSLDSIQSIEEIEDKISGYSGIANLMVIMDQKPKGLEIADQVFDLCAKVPDKKTRIYLLGNLALLYLQLKDRNRSAQAVAEILKILSSSTLKTQGLGTIVMDLSAAGEFVLAFQIVKAIRDPHIKSSAIANIAKSLIESGQETTEIREIAKEVIISAA